MLFSVLFRSYWRLFRMGVLRRRSSPVLRLLGKRRRLPRAPGLFAVTVVGVTFATAVLAVVVYAQIELFGVSGLASEEEVDVKTGFDLLRNGFAVVAGLGAVIVLITTYRKQRTAERAEQREDVRLFTERFTAAFTHLGDDHAPVRLGAVNALAALADDAPTDALRQMCIDQLCSYLRMPFPPEPPAREPGTDMDAAEHDRLRLESAAFREVRRTIIRAVVARLREDGHVSWRGRDFDLTGAVIEDGDFSKASFTGGRVSFAEAVFTGTKADFHRAVFSGAAVDFRGADFATEKAVFTGARFAGGGVAFDHVRFSRGEALFDAEFIGGTVDFHHVTLGGGRVDFSNASFLGGDVSFRDPAFEGPDAVLDFVGEDGAAAELGGNASSEDERVPAGLEEAVRNHPDRIRLPQRWQRL